VLLFFFSSRRRHTSFSRDWSSDVCSSDLDIITSASDFRLITEAPVPIDPYLESKHLQIHQDAADDGEIQSWGFADTISALLNIRSEERRVGKEWRSGNSRYH